jgi:shikimate kinase
VLSVVLNRLLLKKMNEENRSVIHKTGLVTLHLTLPTSTQVNTVSNSNKLPISANKISEFINRLLVDMTLIVEVTTGIFRK